MLELIILSGLQVLRRSFEEKGRLLRIVKLKGLSICKGQLKSI